MTENRTEISINELNRIIGNRDTLHYSPADLIIEKKNIRDKISINDRNNNRGVYTSTLIFRNCAFYESVQIGHPSKAGYIKFEDCMFYGSVTAEYRKAPFSGNCIFNNDLSVTLSGGEIIEINDYDVEGSFTISGDPRTLILKNINKKNRIIEQSVNIRVNTGTLSIDGLKANTLQFSNRVEISHRFFIENIKVSSFIIGKIDLKADLHISNCTITKLTFEKTNRKDVSFTINNSIVKLMEFNINTFKNASFRGGKFNHFALSDSNEKDSIINIEKATITNLKFDSVYNNGIITLRELSIPPEGIVSFRSSNLGKADFIYCNFSKATLEFENSKITEAFFSETEFPEKILVNGKKNHAQAQLTFGQLATAFQKQGDNIRALEYASRELEAHYKTLTWSSAAFFHKLNLWLNSISNDFGRSWVTGVIFSFAAGLIFFCLLLVSTDNYSCGWPRFDEKMLPAYLKFMNPLRFFELDALFNNTSKEGVVKLNGRSYLADFGGRIFVAYGYYQTIQAFRRFGRK